MVILEFVIAFGIMMALHELGHFLVSKAFGIEVEEFGLGMPPRICRLFTWKGTEFTLNWIPFGAFVRPKGEFEDPSENSLRSAPAWKQILILLAGPLMNLLTAAVIIVSIVHQIGNVNTSIVLVDEVVPNTPAEAGGLMPGDRFLSMNDVVIDDGEKLTATVQENLDRPLHMLVSRGGETLELTVTPRSNPPEGQGSMGIVITYPIDEIGWGESIRGGFESTGVMIRQYIVGLVQLITGKLDLGLESIVGPVGMFSYYQDAVKADEAMEEETEERIEKMRAEGLDTSQRTTATLQTNGINRFSFFAMIAICLGVTNLFPIPALDGGRILLLLPELFTGKKIPAKVENTINSVFMILLFILMFLVMFKDIFMMKH